MKDASIGTRGRSCALFGLTTGIDDAKEQDHVKTGIVNFVDERDLLRVNALVSTRLARPACRKRNELPFGA